MTSAHQIEIIKKWTSWVASMVIVLFTLIIFWGVISFVMKFLGVGRYFSLPPVDESVSISSVKERNVRMAEFLKERTLKRQNASMPQTLGSGEKDPFNLP